MNSEKIIVTILGVILLGGALALYMFRDDNWWINYKTDSDDPYGLYIVHEMLQEHAGNDNMIRIEQKMADTLKTFDEGNYIFIGSQFFGDSATIAEIIAFAEKGNTALIAFQYRSSIVNNLCGYAYEDVEGVEPEIVMDTNIYYDPEREIYDTVYYEQEEAVAEEENLFFEEGNEDRTATAVIAIGDLSKEIFRRNVIDTIAHSWNNFSRDTAICAFETVGTINNTPNLIRFKAGKGQILLHHTPLVFTNYFARQDFFLNYYNEIFKNFNGKTVIWDEDSRTPNYESGSHYTPENNSPLTEFLKIENFRWAWYTLLIMFMLMIVFGAKRKQRIIPIIKHKENSSKEYIETIGSLYYQSEDHASLAKLKLKLFNQHLFRRYGMLLSEEVSVIEKLSVVSGVEKSLVNDIAKKQKAANHLGHVSSDFLISLYLSIEKFMSNGK